MKNIFVLVKDNKRKVFIGICLIFSMFLIAFASYNVNKLFANLSGDEAPVNTAFDDINFYKFHIMKEFLSTFIKRSEISNLKNILSVFDIAEFDKFEIKYNILTVLTSELSKFPKEVYENIKILSRMKF